MLGTKSYNYESFTRRALMKDVLVERSGGPRPGEPAPDFRAYNLEGEEVSLEDFLGETNLVLTFGSATCPFSAASIRELNALRKEYEGAGVRFVFVYVREAHPGEHLPAHRNLDDKLRAAALFQQAEKVEIPIVVDDLKGSAHRKYGKLPNPTYLIDKSGRVAFRSRWTRASVLEEALEELLTAQQDGRAHVVVRGGEDTSMPTAYAMLHTHRALERGGRKSIEDFRREMGVSGRLAINAGRVLRPVTVHPARTAAAVGLTAGVIVGSLLLGRFLRQQRLRRRTPYEGFSVSRRGREGNDYEAVGI